MPNTSASPPEGIGKRPRTKKPDKPTVEVDTSETEWSIYIDSWSRYKIMCELTEVAEMSYTQAVNQAHCA